MPGDERGHTFPSSSLKAGFVLGPAAHGRYGMTSFILIGVPLQTNKQNTKEGMGVDSWCPALGMIRITQQAL